MDQSLNADHGALERPELNFREEIVMERGAQYFLIKSYDRNMIVLVECDFTANSVVLY
jgi:hypothetical protein